MRPLRLLTTGTLSSPVSVLMSILLGLRQRWRFCLGLENWESSKSSLFCRREDHTCQSAQETTVHTTAYDLLDTKVRANNTWTSYLVDTDTQTDH